MCRKMWTTSSPSPTRSWWRFSSKIWPWRPVPNKRYLYIGSSSLSILLVQTRERMDKFSWPLITYASNTPGITVPIHRTISLPCSKARYFRFPFQSQAWATRDDTPLHKQRKASTRKNCIDELPWVACYPENWNDCKLQNRDKLWNSIVCNPNNRTIEIEGEDLLVLKQKHQNHFPWERHVRPSVLSTTP